MTIENIGDLLEIASAYQAEREGFTHHVYVCGGGGCISSNCIQTRDALVEYLTEKELTDTVGTTFTGCMGLCALGPVMVVEPEGVFYVKVTPQMAREIVDRHILGGQIVEEYTFYDPNLKKHIPYKNCLLYTSDAADE